MLYWKLEIQNDLVLIYAKDKGKLFIIKTANHLDEKKYHVIEEAGLVGSDYYEYNINEIIEHYKINIPEEFLIKDIIDIKDEEIEKLRKLVEDYKRQLDYERDNKISSPYPIIPTNPFPYDTTDDSKCHICNIKHKDMTYFCCQNINCPSGKVTYCNNKNKIN